MNILLTFDSGYAPHASVVMESIIRHCPEKLDFWILYVHLDTDIIRKMKEHYKRYGSVDKFYICRFGGIYPL